MSDTEDHETGQDDFRNDSVNFDLGDDVVEVDDAVYSDQEEETQPVSTYEPVSTYIQPVSTYNKIGRGSPTLTAITEETTVDSRRASPVETERLAGGVSPVNSADKSAFEEANTFGGSFGGAYGGPNLSAEFSGNDAMAVIQRYDNRANPSVPSQLNESARKNMQIPHDFNFGNALPQNSWDQGHVSCDLGRSFKSSPPQDAPASQLSSSNLSSKSSTGKPPLEDVLKEARDPPLSLRKETVQASVRQVSAATPQKQSPIDISTTPVRPKARALRRDTQLGAISSTPKITRGAPSPIEFGDISAIALNNTTMNSTAGDLLSKSKVFGDIGPKASIDEMMERLEKFRLGQAKKRDLSMTTRAPLRDKTQPIAETPAKSTQMDGTLFKTAREMSLAPSDKENKSASSSYHTASQHTGSTASSRIASSDTMSDMFSRPSSTMQDCISRPDTRLSTASSLTDGAFGLKITQKFLCFGYVDVGSTLVNSLPVTNRGQLAVSVKLSLLKQRGGYKLLCASIMQLEPGETGQVVVEFQPTVNQRHNNILTIESINTGESFKVPFRGTGGTASVTVEYKRETISRNKFGVYLLKPGTVDDSIFFKLDNKGLRRAFCVVVVYVDQQPFPCQVLPYSNFCLKPGAAQDIQIKIENIGRFLTGGNLRTSTHSVDSASSLTDSRLSITVYWGDEVQRLRMKALLTKDKDEIPNHPMMASFLGQFANEKPFDEPSDYPVQPSDVKLFEVGLSKADIMVTPFPMTPLNYPDGDVTIASEQTFGNSIYNEKTLVPDGDDTVVLRR